MNTDDHINVSITTLASGFKVMFCCDECGGLGAQLEVDLLKYGSPCKEEGCDGTAR